MTSALPENLPFAQHLSHGIHAIDTGFHRADFDAAYLMIERGRAAFIDTGTNDSVPRLLAALEASGLQRAAVDYVIATHVHLDHAGGAGLLMQHLPNARLVVHPIGAPHLIDPARLMAGAQAVYGEEEVARTYGRVQGVAAERVLRTADDASLDLAGRPLRFIDTPGHARHHHCIWDERSRGFFTGDTFGLSYREFDTAAGAWIMPTTTPVQFEPEKLRHSVERMLAFEPAYMYLTHYGRVGDVARLGKMLLGQLAEMVALALSLPEDPLRHAALMQGFLEIHLKSLRAHGCTLPEARIADLLALDNQLNAQGTAVVAQPQEPIDRIRRMTAVHFHLEDQVAIVTGAAQGIGAACAERLSQDGAAVALWDLDEAAGQALADRLVASGRRAFFHRCNVAIKAEVDAALAATLEEFGRVDALVSNAGIFKAADFLDITEADWDAVIDVNLKGSFLVGQAVAKAMVAAGHGGAIVNMSSVNGIMTIPSIASYNASKGGVNQLTRVMALALADHGIRVNAVAPGTIATELARNAVLGSEEAKQRIMSRTPMKRLGEPSEIADVCAFLLSSASSYVTGEIVYIDGGRMTLNYTVTS